MFIKNYSDTDLVIEYHSNVYTLKANDVTYVDESWISLAMVKAMFGNYVEEVSQNTPIEEFLFDNQQIAELDKVYLSRGKGPGAPRIFVTGGTVDIYFSDGKDIPASESDMALFDDYTGVTGLIVMDVMPKWTLFKTNGSGVEVVVTNIELVEQ